MSRPHLPMILLTFLLTGILSVTALAQEPTASAQEPVAKASTEKVSAAEREAKIAEKRRNMTSQIWWNQPQKIQEISLSEAQRKRMDTILMSYLENRPEEKPAQQQALDAFGAALAGEDPAAIKRQGDHVVETMAHPIRGQIDMMIEVAAVLSPEQRRKLVSLYPQIFSRLWVVSSNPRSLMKGRGRRQ